MHVLVRENCFSWKSDVVRYLLNLSVCTAKPKREETQVRCEPHRLDVRFLGFKTTVGLFYLIESDCLPSRSWHWNVLYHHHYFLPTTPSDLWQIKRTGGCYFCDSRFAFAWFVFSDCTRCALSWFFRKALSYQPRLAHNLVGFTMLLLRKRVKSLLYFSNLMYGAW